MSTPIPQPPGVFLLGNIFDVDPNNTWVSLKKLADKYGEIFKITVLGQQIVFVAGASLCEEICDEKRFRKWVGGPIAEIRYSVHDALFTAYDNESSWGVAHRIMAPLLSESAVAAQFAEMRDLGAELISQWTRSQGGNRVDLNDGLKRLNLEAVAQCQFGKRLHCLTGPEAPMLKGMEDATSEAMKRPTRPKLVNYLFFQRKLSTATQIMREFSASLVEHRKSNPTDRKDMLNALLHAKDPQTGDSLDAQRVIDEIATVFIGTTTAPGLVASALYYLLKNPDYIPKAREEIDRVIGTAGEFTDAHLAQLPFCDAVLKESLRLCAAAPGFNIEPLPSPSTDPVALAGGKYQIPRGQNMIIVLAAVNRDPAVFAPDPGAFRPERMLEPHFGRLPAGVTKWFGNGKRECVGKRYAWQWALLTLVMVLREVEMQMSDPGYELRQDGWFNLRPVGFEVDVTVRAR